MKKRHRPQTVKKKQRFLLLTLGGVALAAALFTVALTMHPPLPVTSDPPEWQRADSACRDIQEACRHKSPDDPVCAAAKPPVC